jgi:hypothetical protein
MDVPGFSRGQMFLALAFVLSWSGSLGFLLLDRFQVQGEIERLGGMINELRGGAPSKEPAVVQNSPTPAFFEAFSKVICALCASLRPFTLSPFVQWNVGRTTPDAAIKYHDEHVKYFHGQADFGWVPRLASLAASMGLCNAGLKVCEG